MKYFPLVWAGLWRKPLRTTFTLLSLLVAFVLFGMVQGLGAGFDALVGTTKEDRIFTDPRFGLPVPRTYAEQIASVKGVRVVAPRMGLFGYYQDPKNTMGIITTDERFLQSRDELHVPKEQMTSWKATRAGLLIGIGNAKKFNLKVGDQFPFRSTLAKKDGTSDWTFEISGIIEDATDPGNSTFMLAHYDYVNEARVADPDKIDRFLIRIDDPRHAAEISKEIDNLFANSSFPTRTQSDRYQAQSATGSIGDIHFFVNAIVGSVMFMLLFMTVNTMMQSYRERIPELAVLKTLGFADGALLMLVIAESLVQCLLGAGLGLALARALVTVIHGAIPGGLGRLVIVPWLTILLGVLTALFVAIASGIAPAWRAKQLNVVDGLAGR